MARSGADGPGLDSGRAQRAAFRREPFRLWPGVGGPPLPVSPTSGGGETGGRHSRN